MKQNCKTKFGRLFDSQMERVRDRKTQRMRRRSACLRLRCWSIEQMWQKLAAGWMSF